MQPSCRSGPPLSLDWSYSKASTKSVDDYELERFPERVRNPANLRVNKYTRRNMLAFHWGHSQEEMKKARSETKKLQRQRSMTQALLPVHMAHEVCIGIKSLITKKRHDSLNGDDMSELSLSTSKHVESINNSRHTGSMNGSIHAEGSPRSPRAYTESISGPVYPNEKIHAGGSSRSTTARTNSDRIPVLPKEEIDDDSLVDHA